MKIRLFGGLKELKKDIITIKDELTDHLEAINQNTNEIQTNDEFILELESKITKLNEKLDILQLMLEDLTNKQINFKNETITIQPLSMDERKIFLVLYTSEQSLAYEKLSLKTGFSESVVSDFITSMIKKGIPLIKEYINGKARVRLDSEFKEMQAKENLLVFNQQKLNSFIE